MEIFVFRFWTFGWVLFQQRLMHRQFHRRRPNGCRQQQEKGMISEGTRPRRCCIWRWRLCIGIFRYFRKECIQITLPFAGNFRIEKKTRHEMRMVCRNSKSCSPFIPTFWHNSAELLAGWLAGWLLWCGTRARNWMSLCYTYPQKHTHAYQAEHKYIHANRVNVCWQSSPACFFECINVFFFLLLSITATHDIHLSQHTHTNTHTLNRSYLLIVHTEWHTHTHTHIHHFDGFHRQWKHVFYPRKTISHGFSILFFCIKNQIFNHAVKSRLFDKKNIFFLHVIFWVCVSRWNLTIYTLFINWD